jgi:hypothetical protein
MNALGPRMVFGAAELSILFFFFAIAWGIQILIAWIIYSAQSTLPPQHRRMEPGLVWLLLIPLFHLIWNFFVFQQVPDSFQSYFASRGQPQIGATEKSIGLWYSICAACAIVPCVGLFVAITALVLLIIFLVKISALKKMVIDTMPGGFDVLPPSQPPQ